MVDLKIIVLLAVIGNCVVKLFAIENDWTNDCIPCRCKWMSGRKMADCSASELTELPNNLSAEVQSLDLSLNRITALTGDDFVRIGLVNLQKIYLKHCQIKEVHKDAFRSLTLLIELDLSNNRIHTLHADTFRDNGKLRVLLLNGNPLEKLEILFSNHVILQTIELSNCSITYVDHKTFTNVPHLSTLKLDGNRLTNLNVSAFESLKKLRSFEIRNNPWTCDCKLRSFRDWIIDGNLYTLPTICKEPPGLQGRLWTDVSSDQFVCNDDHGANNNSKPIILSPSKNGTKIYISGSDTVTLSCRVTGQPKPRTHWIYNNSRIIINDDGSGTSGFNKTEDDYNFDGKYTLTENQDGSRFYLTINRLRTQDDGDYSCLATNANGVDVRNMTVTLLQQEL